MDSKISEQEERLSNLENRNQRADELYRREKEVHDNAMGVHMTEVTALEERLLQCRDTTTEDIRIASASRRVADERSRKNFNRDEFQRMRKELMDGIMDVVTKCADHR